MTTPTEDEIKKKSLPTILFARKKYKTYNTPVGKKN